MKNFTFLTAVLFSFLLSGCMTLMPDMGRPNAGLLLPEDKNTHTQTGKISSDPAGATVDVLGVGFWQKTTVGKTPVTMYIQKNRPSSINVVTLSLEGFETTYWVADSVAFDQHFKLRPAFDKSIAKELPTYPKEYVSRVFDVVSKFDKALNSPRFLFNSIATEAKNEKQKLDIDFPDQKTSACHDALNDLIGFYAWISMGGADTPTERKFVGESFALIKRIKTGLGI